MCLARSLQPQVPEAWRRHYWPSSAALLVMLCPHHRLGASSLHAQCSHMHPGRALPDRILEQCKGTALAALQADDPWTPLLRAAGSGVTSVFPARLGPSKNMAKTAWYHGAFWYFQRRGQGAGHFCMLAGCTLQVTATLQSSKWSRRHSCHVPLSDLAETTGSCQRMVPAKMLASGITRNPPHLWEHRASSCMRFGRGYKRCSAVLQAGALTGAAGRMQQLVRNSICQPWWRRDSEPSLHLLGKCWVHV